MNKSIKMLFYAQIVNFFKKIIIQWKLYEKSQVK